MKKAKKGDSISLVANKDFKILDQGSFPMGKRGPEKIYVVITHEIDYNKPLFPDRPRKDGDWNFVHEKRTVAWYSDLKTAKKCITENWGDIHETGYNYASIEETLSGLYPFIEKEHWYEWKGKSKKIGDGKYIPCEKPERFKNVVNFGIG